MKVLKDLQTLILEQQKHGNGVVLMIDTNEDIETGKQNELAEFLLETQLEDFYKARKQTTLNTTYARGSKRLDYIFISPQLLPTVQKSGYLVLHDGIISYHRMCYMDVDMVTILGGNVNQILHPYQQVFKCNDKV